MSVKLEEAKHLKTEMEKMRKIAKILKMTNDIDLKSVFQFKSLSSKARNWTAEDLSVTSVAPTMEDVDLELSQYEDLLGDVFPNKSNILNESSCNFTGLCSQPISVVNSSAPFSWQDGLKELENILKHSLSDLNDGEGELDLEGIDDSELDEMILGEDEVKIKTLRWMREYADFLREMKEKKEKKPLKRSKLSTEEFPIKMKATKKKIRLDTTEYLPGVQKHEAESDIADSNDNNEMTEAAV